MISDIHLQMYKTILRTNRIGINNQPVVADELEQKHHAA